jgi:hypothetical protein
MPVCAFVQLGRLDRDRPSPAVELRLFGRALFSLLVDLAVHAAILANYARDIIILFSYRGRYLLRSISAKQSNSIT